MAAPSQTRALHRALTPPDISWLRKMSMNTVIRIQNHLASISAFG